MVVCSLLLLTAKPSDIHSKDFVQHILQISLSGNDNKAEVILREIA